MKRIRINESQKRRLFTEAVETDINKRTLAIDGRYKWDVNEILDEDSNRIPSNNGYFGAYTLIKYRGKEAIVYVDDRDAKVKVCSDWFDTIYYGAREFGYKACWDGDHRWNHDMPIIVQNDGLYNAAVPHKPKLLMTQWVKELDKSWSYNQTLGDYLSGVDVDGNEIIVLKNGDVKRKKFHTPEAIERIPQTVKSFDSNETEELWINKGLPCMYQKGLTYKGGGRHKISAEEAKELIKTHRRFNGMFNELSWEVVDGTVCLVFHDYTDSDYD